MSEPQNERVHFLAGEIRQAVRDISVILTSAAALAAVAFGVLQVGWLQ